ncbi:hypothetical protein BGZ90_008423, partial [Linnemannia elongata]
MLVSTTVPVNSSFKWYTVTILWEEKLGFSIYMRQDITILYIKHVILKILKFKDLFDASTTLLMIMSEFNNHQKYASLPYKGS